MSGIAQRTINLLVVGWNGQLNQGRHLLGRNLDPIIQHAPCDVIVLHDRCPHHLKRILVPVAGGPNAPEAFGIAQALDPEAQITALYVASQRLGMRDVLLGEERLNTVTQDLPNAGIVRKQVVQAGDPVEGILDEAEAGYDLMIVGAGGGTVVDRFIFGDIPQALLMDSPIPVMIIRRRLTYLRTFGQRLWTRIFGLLPTLTIQEQAAIYKTMRRSSRPSTDFFVMITLTAGIAALGLLLNSPAVIIGAMLVAPLMTAILGMGLSIVMGDTRFFWISASTTVRGMLLAVITGLLVALVVPGDAVTNEILSRVHPTLLDLGVALVSGVAAAYAISRRDVSAALAGVAIAAALAPPLTTVGIGVQMRDWTIAGGALLLFLTNMVSIVASGGLMFFLLGFHPDPSRPGRSRILQRGVRSVAVLLLLVTLPLGLLTHQSLQEVRLRENIEATLQQEIAQETGAQLVSWQMQGEAPDGTLHLDVTIRTLHSLSYQDAKLLQEQIAARLERPVALALSMVPTARLQAYIPPTPTPTGAPTATPTATATPRLRVVSDEVDPGGLCVRYSPGGLEVARIAGGTTVIVLVGPVTVDETPWMQIRNLDGTLQGWVVAGYLLAQP